MKQSDAITKCYTHLFTALEHARYRKWIYFAYYYGQCEQLRRHILEHFEYDIRTESEFVHHYDIAAQTFIMKCVN